MDYKIDLHTHTLASGHAYNTIDEMLNDNELVYSPEGGITLNHLSIQEYIASLEDGQIKVENDETGELVDISEELSEFVGKECSVSVAFTEDL